MWQKDNIKIKGKYKIDKIWKFLICKILKETLL